MKPRNYSTLLAIAAAACGLSAPAQILVNDTWLDATRTDPTSPTYSEYGVDGDLDGDKESAWFRSGTGSSTTMSAGHMIHAAGASSSMSLTTYFAPTATAVTLGNIGDQLRITWVFKPNGVTTTSTSQDMRLAIVDSLARVTTDATPANQVYSGYGIFFNMRGPTLGNAASLRAMEWAVPGGANNLLSTTAAWSANASTTSIVGTTPGFTSGNTYTVLWSITRTASGADIYQSITDSGGLLDGDGVLDLTYSDTTAQALSFDTFAIRPQTPELTATSFDTTQFKVEFLAAVPEPTAAALIGLGLMGLLLNRRGRC